LGLGVKAIIFFSLSPMPQQNKLECLSLANVVQASLTISSKAKSQPRK